jgi:hypothetical protein
MKQKENEIISPYEKSVIVLLLTNRNWERQELGFKNIDKALVKKVMTVIKQVKSYVINSFFYSYFKWVVIDLEMKKQS